MLGGSAGLLHSAHNAAASGMPDAKNTATKARRGGDCFSVSSEKKCLEAPDSAVWRGEIVIRRARLTLESTSAKVKPVDHVSGEPPAEQGAHRSQRRSVAARC